MLRHRTGAVALAGMLALAQLGAAAAEENRGTASTDLLGASLEVDTGSLATVLDSLTNGSLVPATVDVLGVGTYASTDRTDRTAHDTSLAEAAAVPLRVGEDEVAPVRASTSDGTESGTSGGGTFGAVNDVASAVGASVAPVVLEVSASADEASAVVDILLADVTALLQTVDLDIEVSQLSSIVDELSSATGASIEVSGLDLTLGDLLPLEVLEQLPLSAILDLLASLNGITPDVAGAISDIEAAFGAVDLSALEDAVDALEVASAPFNSLLDTLVSLEAALSASDGSDLLTLLGELATAIGTATGLGVTIPASCTAVATLPQAMQCVQDLQAATVTQATTALADEIAAVTSADVLDQLEAAVTALSELIGDLLDLDGLAATELLSVEGFIVGLSAVSTGTTDTSHAVVGCSPVTATVLGTAYTTPSCSEGLSAVQGVAAAVNDAVGTVQGILASLPLADVAAVGDLELELFGHLAESVAQDGEYVVATAGVELLDLRLPALTIDPAAFGVDPLASLPDLTAVLEAVQSELDAATSAIEDLVAGTPLESAVVGVDLRAIQEAIGFLTGIDLDVLTTSFTTPSLRLVIDPASTAEFATAAPPAAAPPDGGDPTLPTTGGGAALIGVLGLAGAFALLRRRD